MTRRRPSIVFAAIGVFAALSIVASAQDLPKSGTLGADLFWITESGTGNSQLAAVALAASPVPIPLTPVVANVPSRWAHRRRYLGALETEIAIATPFTFLTPMGGSLGQGGIHMLDLRAGFLQTTFVSTANPPGFDLAFDANLQQVFAAVDNGLGQTTIYGFSYAVPGVLAPLSPPSLTIAGSPAAGACRIALDPSNGTLHVPTTAGVQIVAYSATAQEMALGPFVAMGTAVPVTSVAIFDFAGAKAYAVGTSTFNPSGSPIAAGVLAYDAAGTMLSGGEFGVIPGLFPLRSYVQAAGTQELAVVANGTRAYIYFLLRDPSPTAFFIRPSAVGVVKLDVAQSPSIGTLVCSEACGEPFSLPSVSGTRVAFESSQGPPFSFVPPDGSERISIIYSPLDPLGAATPFGLMQTAGPLQGRISTKGMDRPIWSHDGLRVISSTSAFPGAPQPGNPGLEVLDVPANIPINEYLGPQTVVSYLPFPNQTINFPSVFLPRDPFAASFLSGFTFAGSISHGGTGGVMLFPFGQIGQLQTESVPFVQSPLIPNFPGLVRPSNLDATSPTVPLPGTFGARRTTFNLVPGLGLTGLLMSGAVGSEIVVQATGWNFQTAFGLNAGSLGAFHIALPAGWITSSEFLSL